MTHTRKDRGVTTAPVQDPRKPHPEGTTATDTITNADLARQLRDRARHQVHGAHRKALQAAALALVATTTPEAAHHTLDTNQRLTNDIRRRAHQIIDDNTTPAAASAPCPTCGRKAP